MELISGYRIPYSPWAAIEKLDNAAEDALDELWENLYHQGDVDTASYAAVPKLIEKGFLDLAAAIEVARHSPQNPELPSEIKAEYFNALKHAIATIPSQKNQLLAYYSIHASVQGHRDLARVLDFISIEEIMNEIG